MLPRPWHDPHQSGAGSRCLCAPADGLDLANSSRATGLCFAIVSLAMRIRAYFAVMRLGAYRLDPDVSERMDAEQFAAVLPAVRNWAMSRVISTDSFRHAASLTISGRTLFVPTKP